MRLLVWAALGVVLVPVAHAKSTKEEREAYPKRKVLPAMIAYIPNRVLDLLDVVRVRARVGPGIGVGVRATEWADAFAGVYAAGYAGLPGPRNRALPKLPLGIELQAGVEVSKADLATGLFLFDPDYGETEFGVDLHVLLVGAAVGFDPGELADFFVGFGMKDIKDDDLRRRKPRAGKRRSMRE